MDEWKDRIDEVHAVSSDLVRKRDYLSRWDRIDAALESGYQDPPFFFKVYLTGVDREDRDALIKEVEAAIENVRSRVRSRVDREIQELLEAIKKV